MESRMDKYSSNNSNSQSRINRNKKLYDNLYDNTLTTYSNSIVIDEGKEIDINKIKEIIDLEKNKEKKEERPEINFDELNKVNFDETQKIFDINEVLKDAKSKRDIIAEASEKRKATSIFEDHLNAKEELEKTKQVYDKLLQEETELLDIMNTLTNVSTTTDIKTAYKDLTMESTKKDLNKEETKQVENPKELEKTKTNNIPKPEVYDDLVDDNTDSTEYSTNTFMFNKKDFVSEEIEDSLKGTNNFIKFLIVVLSIAIILGAYYIVTNYVLK